MVDFVGVPLYGGFGEELADELSDVELKQLELLGSSEELPGSSDELSVLFSEDASTEVPLLEVLVELVLVESEISELVFTFEESDPPPLSEQPLSAAVSVIVKRAARINEIVLILFFIASPLVFLVILHTDGRENAAKTFSPRYSCTDTLSPCP